MTKTKKYWKGLAELNNDPIVEKLAQNEFTEEIPVDEFLGDSGLANSSTSRRDFLKFLGFSTAAATLAACETPVNKVIPYVVKPEETVPGIANYYASTIYDGHDFASVLVKTREGRPIKLESNKTCTNARVQASVLSLYDSARLRNPMKDGKDSDWKTVDTDITSKLNEIKNNGGNIALLTSTIISPTTEKLISDFSEKYGNVKHIQMDALSSHGMLEANLETFGVRALPNYNFDKADVIVSFGADFIGNWGHPNNESDYSKGRNPKNGKMSKHFQVESTLTLTGSNADERIQIKPSEQAGLLSNLYNALNGSSTLDKRIAKIVDSLIEAKTSIVVCNSNDKEVQLLVNAINNKLGNYGSTIDMQKTSYLRKGNDKDVSNLVDDINSGKIDALITYNVNPSYNLVNADEFNKGLGKVDLKISTSLYMDETAINMDYVCPDNHNLESWGDANPSNGEYTLMQPTINPLFNGRQFQDSLLSWIGSSEEYYNLLKNSYSSWEEKLHDGYFEGEQVNHSLTSNFSAPSFSIPSSKGIEFEISEKISMGDGSNSNNPWLQELPDPLSRACWDNYLTMSASTARDLGIKNWHVSNGALNGSKVNITVNSKTLENVPVLIQPGQAVGSVAMAVGYGRTNAGKCGTGVGHNAFTFVNGGKADISIIEGEHEFAGVQLHHTMMGRDIVKETTLADFINDPSSGNHREKYYTHDGLKTSDQVTLWDKHDHQTGHFWNQSIDLTLCTGCAACVISCHAENNVPVVGKEEVRKSRDMHWLRIDRYFSSEMTKERSAEEKISAIDMYSEMEDPSENPEVVFQPVMCQHCNNAPCETVCPVAATTHSAEGLNHMTYNRCVGTRYCANNCPYKVRRFNWFQYSDNDKFDYNMNDDYGKMVLNPDVVVRSRGVIEKCSMCIQMIQEIKLKAKTNGVSVKDEDVQTACSSACSTGAMIFGDSNDSSHEIYNLKNDPRKYDLLDHLNVAPSVFYQTKVRNKS
ncbi:MAG: quinol:cytochrome C oxidoreductase [Flavobacteriales bacterium]|nr:quinol:cytochrome C oxidoreductase [Flavobacteriales bacterium]|tara:strand:- start:19995 stop:22946 length:2952 start_codon:yes stop_codon:yes gene_type:complete